MCGPKTRSPKSQNVIHVPGGPDININGISVCDKTLKYF